MGRFRGAITGFFLFPADPGRTIHQENRRRSHTRKGHNREKSILRFDRTFCLQEKNDIKISKKLKHDLIFAIMRIRNIKNISVTKTTIYTSERKAHYEHRNRKKKET